MRVLAGTTEGMTGRQVHRLVGHGALRSAQRALDRFAEEGLLDVKDVGASNEYTFNREHIAAPAVMELVSLRTKLLERLRQEFATWKPAPVHVSLFGSAARGDGDTGSDIDLLVVRPNAVDEEDPRWRAQLDELSEKLPRWTGNQPGVAELSETEVQAMLTDRPPILEELHNDAVSLKGASFSRYTRDVA